MKTHKLSIGLIVVTIFAASQPAFAQVYGQGYQNLINTFITNKIWEQTLNYSKKRGQSSSTKVTPDPIPNYGNVIDDTAVTPEQVKRAVRFNPSGSRLSLNEYVDALGWSAQESADTKITLSGFLNMFDAKSTELGYPNDMPLAIITHIVVNSTVYNDKPQMSNDQILELRNSLAIQLTRGGTFTGMSDRQKQGIYEFLLMDAGLLQFSCDKAKKEKNTEELRLCKVVAKDRLKRLGIEVQ